MAGVPSGPILSPPHENKKLRHKELFEICAATFWQRSTDFALRSCVYQRKETRVDPTLQMLHILHIPHAMVVVQHDIVAADMKCCIYGGNSAWSVTWQMID